jgi:hypothetical protein
MNDDALKKLWQEQSFRSLPPLPDEAQIAAMKMRMQSFDRTISSRDYGEVAACIFIGIFFGWSLIFQDNSPLTRAGCVVLIASAVFIGWKLIASKRRLPQAEPNAPIFDAVKVELQKVENQISLLQSVAWWYLLPLFVGVMMCYWGGPGSLASKLTYFAVVLVVYGFIYWLNQRAVKTNLLPLKQELASLLHSAETGEPLDEAHVARLRRIARSMRAGSQVKAVEFKVAFWQIGLYGEIGFIGMWIIMIFGLTMDKIHQYPNIVSFADFIAQIFIWQHVIWIVPFFLGGLVYTWLLQKWTERAVGISALGVHLEKGMNLILWDEIKEVRPLRVLNIRSLWLIRESGEKSIMPWTSLERHSELRAAVETFAPANHPLRKHLSLLRPESREKE